MSIQERIHTLRRHGLGRDLIAAILGVTPEDVSDVRGNPASAVNAEGSSVPVLTAIDPETFGTGVTADTGAPGYVVEGAHVRLVGFVQVAAGSAAMTGSSPLFVLPAEIKPTTGEILEPGSTSLWFPVIGEQFPPVEPWAGACALNLFVDYPTEGMTEVYLGLLAFEPVDSLIVHLNGGWGF